MYTLCTTPSHPSYFHPCNIRTPTLYCLGKNYREATQLLHSLYIWCFMAECVEVKCPVLHRHSQMSLYSNGGFLVLYLYLPMSPLDHAIQQLNSVHCLLKQTKIWVVYISFLWHLIFLCGEDKMVL